MTNTNNYMCSKFYKTPCTPLICSNNTNNISNGLINLVNYGLILGRISGFYISGGRRFDFDRDRLALGEYFRLQLPCNTSSVSWKVEFYDLFFIKQPLLYQEPTAPDRWCMGLFGSPVKAVCIIFPNCNALNEITSIYGLGNPVPLNAPQISYYLQNCNNKNLNCY